MSTITTERFINRVKKNDKKINQEENNKSVVLEDDFIAYIVPTIYISSSDGKNFNFCEGNERFLNVI